MTTPEFEPTRVTLLERLRTGKDQTAWLEFESTYRAFIFSLILRMGIPNADAEDISQTVLTKVWQKIEDFEYNRNRGKFHNWLAAMTRNTVKDFFRTKKISSPDAMLSNTKKRTTPSNNKFYPTSKNLLEKNGSFTSPTSLGIISKTTYTITNATSSNTSHKKSLIPKLLKNSVSPKPVSASIKPKSLKKCAPKLPASIKNSPKK